MNNLQTSLKFIITFLILNVIIASVWYIYELITFGELRVNNRDTIICYVLSFVLAMIINNKKVSEFLNKG